MRDCSASVQQSSRPNRAVSQRQPNAHSHIDHRFSERIDERVIVIGSRRGAPRPGASWDGPILVRLDVDATPRAEYRRALRPPLPTLLKCRQRLRSISIHQFADYPKHYGNQFRH
jgi:hypothetical protein